LGLTPRAGSSPAIGISPRAHIHSFMSPAQIKVALLVVVATLISGFGDAVGFYQATKIWDGAKVQFPAMWRSAAGFFVGMVGFWFAARYMKLAGILAPEIQTIIWFGVTILGIAIASGQILRWPLTDLAVAGGVLLGIGWLLYRTGG
jgi:hypothetical protein